MAITFKEFHEVTGFVTDGFSGFQDQLSSKSYHEAVPTPEHYSGKRKTDYEAGAHIGRTWMAFRQGAGSYRQIAHAQQLKEIGATLTMKATNAADLREEQIASLRMAFEAWRDHERIVRQVDAEMDAQLSSAGNSPSDGVRP
jgi:hypothetical protein